MMNVNDFEPLINRLEVLVDRIESLLPEAHPTTDWQAHAFRWRGHLEAVRHPHQVQLDDLLNIEEQKQCLVRNTRQFLAGLPANNVLLTGSRGTGKSSLIKALLTAFAADGLRLIEVDKQDLAELPDIIEPLYGRDERFMLFVDDLSFAGSDTSYNALKAILDGSIVSAPGNVLIYATSNRRHLIPEYMYENREAEPIDGEIHHGESVEEKISLSERFGIWLSFQPFKQAQYLDTVFHWLDRLGTDSRDAEAIRAEALQFALQRGSRSGRIAGQFARHWAGQQLLAE